MNVSASRKIGSATSAPRTERNYAAANARTQFVDEIDAQNNVLVRDDGQDNTEQNKFSRHSESEAESSEFSPSTAYVRNSVEALASSGVLDNNAATSPANNKVSIYDNNQSIIRDEELERTGRNYLKHFYEKNEHLINVDELI